MCKRPGTRTHLHWFSEEWPLHSTILSNFSAPATLLCSVKCFNCRATNLINLLCGIAPWWLYCPPFFPMRTLSKPVSCKSCSSSCKVWAALEKSLPGASIWLRSLRASHKNRTTRRISTFTSCILSKSSTFHLMSWNGTSTSPRTLDTEALSAPTISWASPSWPSKSLMLLAHKRSSSWQLAISRRRSSSKVKAASCSCCDKREVSPCPASRTKAATLKSGFRNVSMSPRAMAFLRASSGWEMCRLSMLSALQSFHATPCSSTRCKSSACHTSTATLKLEFRWRSFGPNRKMTSSAVDNASSQIHVLIFLEEKCGSATCAHEGNLCIAHIALTVYCKGIASFRRMRSNEI